MTLFLRLMVFLALPFLVVSCFKEDVKVLPHQPGNTEIDTIALTSLYKNQVYYDLGTKSAVQTNLRKQWDISFECMSGGRHIRLNTSCFMVAADLGVKDINLPADTTGSKWRFDTSNGNPDSTAFGTWYSVTGSDTVSIGHTYAINRGLDEQGNPRGMRQFVVDSLVNNIFYFRVAGFDGSNVRSYSLAKNPTVNHVLFTFDSGANLVTEPADNTWDLLFTQYTTLLFTSAGLPYPYLVTGVLINPSLVEVAQDSTRAFADISFANVSGLAFSNRQDIIGYDWKFYSFDTGSYTVLMNRNYIIRDTLGFYYKFRFLGFYDVKGEKGYPSIEYQKL